MFVSKVLDLFLTLLVPLGATDPCSEISCSEDEHCGEKHGVYGCLCNTNHNESHSDSFGWYI